MGKIINYETLKKTERKLKLIEETEKSLSKNGITSLSIISSPTSQWIFIPIPSKSFIESSKNCKDFDVQLFSAKQYTRIEALLNDVIANMNFPTIASLEGKNKVYKKECTEEWHAKLKKEINNTKLK